VQQLDPFLRDLDGVVEEVELGVGIAPGAAGAAAGGCEEWREGRREASASASASAPLLWQRRDEIWRRTRSEPRARVLCAYWTGTKGDTRMTNDGERA